MMQGVRSVQVRPKTLIRITKLTKKKHEESVFTGVKVIPLFIAECATNTA